jgi:GNAT superfamily N-acetyltransferase
MNQIQPTVAIRDATARDVDALTALLAAAFMTGPVSDWLVPDPGVRRGIYLALFRVEVQRALEAGYVHVTSDLTAAALWYPRVIRLPGCADYERRVAATYGPYAERFGTMAAVFEKHRPVEPHHYLAYLAVAPPQQNAGLGGVLLDHYAAQLDRIAMPAYVVVPAGAESRRAGVSQKEDTRSQTADGALRCGDGVASSRRRRRSCWSITAHSAPSPAKASHGTAGS